MDPLIGQTLDGRYFVEERIGAGGMGAVYKARHIAMAQPVALKVLLSDLKGDPDLLQRFIREARRSFQIDDPNCVRVTDFNALPDGTPYMVMEYLNGRTIAADIAVDGPMTSKRVRHIAAQTASALDHAHSLGLIHRDLKPANLMLMQRGHDFDFTKVFDFGLAKLFDNGTLTGLSISPLTRAGIVFGTPEYMSPEQALGGDLCPRSDVYSLGVCCYEMLTGSVPFAGETFTVILSRHVKEEPRRPGELRPDLSFDPALEDLIMRCLSKDAGMRPSAAELVSALQEVPDANAPGKSRPIASSETVELSQMALPCDLDPSPVTGRDKTSPVLPMKRRRRGHVGFHCLLAFSAVAVLLLSLRILNGSASEAEPAHVPAPLVPIPAAVSRQSIPADAGHLPPDRRRRETRVAKVARPPANEHLVAAEKAYRTKDKPLGQLFHAREALKEMPTSRRAAFLVGDALLRSGDKVRACEFFRRSSKRHLRAAGCSD